MVTKAVTLLFFFVIVSSAQKLVTVPTANGPVTGTQYASYSVWSGIPYAQPPLGSLRWAAPVPVTSWGPSPFMATSFAPGCPQHCHLPPLFCPANTSEDCLHLNVWTPPNIPSGTVLPVMVFFAGGAFFQGDGGTPIYYGDWFVNTTNVVLVTCSYRLGALGFLVTSDLNGNYGVQDQRLVLQWVQKNIDNFGGDPTRVTIFGESAGAASVATHLTSPQSAGLFHKAIMESNPFAIEFKTTSEAKEYGSAFISDIGCDGSDALTCIRGKSADEVVDTQTKVFPWPDPFDFNMSILLAWGPTVDGTQVPNNPMDAFISGAFNQNIPIMIGTNANEGIMFVWQAISTPGSYLDYVAAVTAGFREDAPEVLAQYPLDIFINDSRPMIAEIVTDYLFGCAARRVAEAVSQFGVPIYLYYFDHVLSFYQAYGPSYQYCKDYVCHGAELAYIFHTAGLGGFNYTTGEQAMSLDMMNYWANFAKSPLSNPSPNYGNTVNVVWNSFGTTTLDNILLEVPVQQQTDLRESYCDFWDSVGYNW